MSCTQDTKRRPWTSIERQYANLAHQDDEDLTVFTVDSARMAVVLLGTRPGAGDWKTAQLADNGTTRPRCWVLVGPGATCPITAAGLYRVWVEPTVGSEVWQRELDLTLDLY
jgi:hypothetical protein